MEKKTMKAGHRRTTMWLENNQILENINITSIYLFCEPWVANLQRLFTTLTDGLPLSDKHHQLSTATPDQSPSTGPFKNHTCPIWRKPICSLFRAFPKPQLASTSQESVPNPKPPKPVMRCHCHYCHLVCSDLTGTLCETVEIMQGIKTK